MSKCFCYVRANYSAAILALMLCIAVCCTSWLDYCYSVIVTCCWDCFCICISTACASERFFAVCFAGHLLCYLRYVIVTQCRGIIIFIAVSADLAYMLCVATLCAGRFYYSVLIIMLCLRNIFSINITADIALISPLALFRASRLFCYLGIILMCVLYCHCELCRKVIVSYSYSFFSLCFAVKALKSII